MPLADRQSCALRVVIATEGMHKSRLGIFRLGIFMWQVALWRHVLDCSLKR